MSITEQATINYIHYLEIIYREIGIEGDNQQATIARVLRPHIPNIIADLQELNEYRRKYGRMDEHGNHSSTHAAPSQDAS